MTAAVGMRGWRVRLSLQIPDLLLSFQTLQKSLQCSLEKRCTWVNTTSVSLHFFICKERIIILIPGWYS